MDSVKMKGFMRLTNIGDALKKFFSQVNLDRMPAENILIIEALGRVLADDVIAMSDVPSFNRAAVDGYVVKAEETFGASPTNPLIFDILGNIEIGFHKNLILERQQAAKIATGAFMPRGSDAVVMVEYTEKVGEGKIEIHSSLTPGENVSQRGEDVKRGEKILSSGTLLHPQEIGIMAALGYKEISVVKKPKVSILSTGNELIDDEQNVGLGKIFDTNRPILFAMVKELGGEPFDLGIAKDNLTDIKSRIYKGIESSDIVLVSGGTSVGTGDLVPEAINALGNPGVIVHGISMKPGKPTALAAVCNKPIVLLPGFPVATMIAFNVIVQPILLRMLGASHLQFERRVIRARMLRRLPSSLGDRTFVRVLVKMLNGNYVVEPLRTIGSGIISSMIRANGLVVIPEEKEGLEEGEEVEVTLFRPIGE